MLERLFQSKTRNSILAIFILKHFSGSIRAIAKEIKCSPMQARNELINLELAGVLTSKDIANAKIYSINQKCPYINELSSLVAKAAGFDIRIKEALNGIVGIEVAFIYGSYANNKFTGKSDLDLFIIGNPDMKIVNSRIFKLQQKIEVEINVSVYDKKEFNNRKKHGFIKNILEGSRVMIMGDEYELG
ncbi:MAG: nucleotidyltransferase domain-containing protein [Candidatus Micrarchaeota archaeon]